MCYGMATTDLLVFPDLLCFISIKCFSIAWLYHFNLFLSNLSVEVLYSWGCCPGVHAHDAFKSLLDSEF